MQQRQRLPFYSKIARTFCAIYLMISVYFRPRLSWVEIMAFSVSKRCFRVDILEDGVLRDDATHHSLRRPQRSPFTFIYPDHKHVCGCGHFLLLAGKYSSLVLTPISAALQAAPSCWLPLPTWYLGQMRCQCFKSLFHLSASAISKSKNMRRAFEISGTLKHY